MPEGHTLFALARDLDAAFRGTAPTATSPQGRFAAGAALISGRTFLHATSWGKHLFVEFEGDAWLHVHLGLIGTFRIDEHGYAGDPRWWARCGCVWSPTTTWPTCAARSCAP